MWIDSHVNLHGERFADDITSVINDATQAGIFGMLNICCDINDMQHVLNVCSHRDNIWASVGVHPHEAKHHTDLDVRKILDFACHDKVIGIGEAGLDYHYNHSSKSEQVSCFLTHIEAARESQLPLIVHTRNADDDMADILERELSRGTFPVLLHCYSSGETLARRAIDFGAWFSLSGIITFKNARELREIVEFLPNDRIMLETDCPYLAPVPYRGRRNEPAYIPHVAAKLAEIKGWSLEETAVFTTQAFFNLFKKANKTLSPALMGGNAK